MKQLIIGLSGEMASGKEVFCRVVKDLFRQIPNRHGNNCVVTHLSTSTMLRQILDTLHRENPPREDYQALGSCLESIFLGYIPDWVDWILRHEEGQKSDIVIIDRISSEFQFHQFKEKFPDLHTVYIDTHADLRYRFYNNRQRQKNRERKTPQKYLELSEFRALHEAPTEVEIPQIKNLADTVIKNAVPHIQIFGNEVAKAMLDIAVKKEIIFRKDWNRLRGKLKIEVSHDDLGMK